MEDVITTVFIRGGSEESQVEGSSVTQLFTEFKGFESKEEAISEEEEIKPVSTRDSKKSKRKLATTDNTLSKRKSYIQKYRKEWETIPAYKTWLSESVLGNLYFYCKFCKNDNKCGRTEIEKHMICKKHINNSKVCLNRTQRKFGFRGLLCPVFTPFKNKDKEVNFNMISEYAHYLHICGIKGVLINDIVGEGMSLTQSERLKLTEYWLTACERYNQHLMVQVGGAPLKDVQEMIYHAEKKKVNSIVVLPDVINKPKDHFELMRYIKLVADCANTLPLLYHHNPSVTGVNVNMQKFLQDIVGEIDNFVGIIFSDNNLHEALSALHVNEDKFTVFIGSDEIMLGAFASGFNSLVAPSLNYLPKLAQTILEAVNVGNLSDANQTQKYLRNILDSIYRYGGTVPAAKTAMNLMAPLNLGLVRNPLVSVWQDQILKMKSDFQRLKIIPAEYTEYDK